MVNKWTKMLSAQGHPLPPGLVHCSWVYQHLERLLASVMTG